jgi:endonuclease/exonuclease/phosphatase (EEP) superfamily protein YafD
MKDLSGRVVGRPSEPSTAASARHDIAEPLRVLLRLSEVKGGSPHRSWQAGIARACDGGAWLYVLVLFGVWLLLRLGGDRWWFPTVLLFGARWVCGLPLAALVPAAVLLRRRLWRPLLAAGLLVFGPIMGCCLPWARLAAAKQPTLRVLTCNVKGNCANNKALNELIRAVSPDIVALQGCWQEVRVEWPAGWHACRQGGLLVASGYPLREVRFAFRNHPPRQWREVHLVSCLVAAPGRSFSFCTIHLESPHQGLAQLLDRRTVLSPSKGSQLEAGIANRWLESAAADQWVQGLAGPAEAWLLAGDFNLPTDSAIYQKFWQKYTNAFSEAGWGFGYTEWPRIRKVPFGIRIDHILTGSGWRPLRCWVGPDIGSDHLPLIAELSWNEPSTAGSRLK